MEDTVTEKMARLLIDIAETNNEILSGIKALQEVNAKLEERIKILEGNNAQQA